MNTEPDRSRRALLAVALGLLVAPRSHAATRAARRGEGLTPASDLAADGRLASAQRVIVLMFSLDGCHFCEVVRQNYLLSLQRDPARQALLLVRELGLLDEHPIRDFDGQSTTARALAARYGVTAAPTLVFVDAQGRPLAPMLAGGDIAGFYGAYLDRALAEAVQQLAR